MKVYTTNPSGDILIGSSRIDVKEGEKWVDIVRDQAGAGQIKIKMTIKDAQPSAEAAGPKLTQSQTTRRPPETVLQVSMANSNSKGGEKLIEGQSQQPEINYTKNEPMKMTEETKEAQHQGPFGCPITQHMMLAMPTGPFPEHYSYLYEQANMPKQEDIQIPQPSPQDFSRDMMYYGGGHMFGSMMNIQGLPNNFVDPSGRQNVCENPSHNAYYGIPAYNSFNPYYSQNMYQVPQNQRNFQTNPYINGQQGTYMYYQQDPNFK